MRVIIAGSRDLADARPVWKAIARFVELHGDITEVVSGGAAGADRIGEAYARHWDLPLSLFPADWAVGRKAGPDRNEAMAKYAAGGGCIVVHTGGRGSADMIRRARAHDLKLVEVDLRSDPGV